MFLKLLLAASLVLACSSKTDMPRAAKRMAAGRTNPVVIIGNGAAYSRILQLGAGASR